MYLQDLEATLDSFGSASPRDRSWDASIRIQKRQAFRRHVSQTEDQSRHRPTNRQEARSARPRQRYRDIYWHLDGILPLRDCRKWGIQGQGIQSRRISMPISAERAGASQVQFEKLSLVVVKLPVVDRRLALKFPGRPAGLCRTSSGLLTLI